MWYSRQHGSNITCRSSQQSDAKHKTLLRMSGSKFRDVSSLPIKPEPGRIYLSINQWPTLPGLLWSGNQERPGKQKLVDPVSYSSGFTAKPRGRPEEEASFTKCYMMYRGPNTLVPKSRHCEPVDNLLWESQPHWNDSWLIMYVKSRGTTWLSCLIRVSSTKLGVNHSTGRRYQCVSPTSPRFKF